MKLTIRDLGRAGHITRFHSVRTARAQTIAEHSFAVCVYARELAKHVYGDKLDTETQLLLLTFTLLHDTPEVLTSDIATPMKRKIKQISESYGHESPVDIIEREIAPEVAELEKKVEGTPLKFIAKIADLLDALSFISEEGIGNHAKAVTKKIDRMFHAKVTEAASAYPDLNWSSCHSVYQDLMHGEDHHIEFENI